MAIPMDTRYCPGSSASIRMLSRFKVNQVSYTPRMTLIFATWVFHCAMTFPCSWQKCTSDNSAAGNARDQYLLKQEKQEDRHSSIDNRQRGGVRFSKLRLRNGLMTRPRKALISLADTPYYHITSRCVPKALRGAGSASRFSLWGGSLLRTELRTPAAMGRGSHTPALLAVRNRCLRLRRHEDIS